VVESGRPESLGEERERGEKSDSHGEMFHSPLRELSMGASIRGRKGRRIGGEREQKCQCKGDSNKGSGENNTVGLVWPEGLESEIVGTSKKCEMSYGVCREQEQKKFKGKRFKEGPKEGGQA